MQFSLHARPLQFVFIVEDILIECVLSLAGLQYHIIFILELGSSLLT